MSNCAIILAGGEGKRMKSDKPKTLSLVLGKPMLEWVISSLKKAGVNDICIVKGFKKECIDTLYEFGSEEQRQKYIPRICAGETMSMDLTEPDASRTTARN